MRKSKMQFSKVFFHVWEAVRRCGRHQYAVEAFRRHQSIYVSNPEMLYWKGKEERNIARHSEVYLRSVSLKEGQNTGTSSPEWHIRWGKSLIIYQLLRDKPTCERCLEDESATHILWYYDILCDCEAIAYLRFRHLGQFFMEPSDYYDAPMNKVLHFIRSVGLIKG
jgi:hypothetical protein